MGNKPCFLESKQWISVIMETNPPSELHYPSRAAFFAIGTARSRLQRDITDFLANKTSQTELQASRLLSRARNRAAERRDWFAIWSAEVIHGTRSLLTEPVPTPRIFRPKIFGSELEIVCPRDIRAYIGFCNTYCHANFHILSMEPCRALLEESIAIAREIYRAVEYHVQSDHTGTSHVSGGLETARTTLALVDEWAKEFEDRCMSEQPGGKSVSFKLWLGYLHANRVDCGYDENTCCRLENNLTSSC